MVAVEDPLEYPQYTEPDSINVELRMDPNQPWLVLIHSRPDKSNYLTKRRKGIQIKT